MLRLMASRKLQTGLLVLGVVGGLAIGTGAVLAWTPDLTVGGQVRMWGSADTQVYLDVDRQYETGDYIHDEVFLYLSVPFGGLASGHPNQPRAEILMERTGMGSADEADAWIKSSGGAEVKVDSDGNIVMTLGS